MPEAGQVFFVWGIDGWNVVPEEVRPVGTVVENAVMRTPMRDQDGTFVAIVQVPCGATVDYGFLITKKRSGAVVQVWEAEGDQGYHTVVEQDGIIEVRTKLVMPEDQAFTVLTHTPFVAQALPRILGDELPLLIGVVLVFAVGAVFLTRRNLVWRSMVATARREQLIYLSDLLREMVTRDMKLRYKRSALGIAWSLLNPLAQFLVLSLIFGLVLPLNIPNYPAFLFTGLLVWTWFQTSLITATGAIVDNPDLIRRPGFPVAILPIITVTTHLIHFLLALPILLLILVFSGNQITTAILTLPLIIILQFLLTLSLAYLVATLHVTFRDTQYLLGIFLLLGFYLSPVFYDTSIIPERYQFFYHLNPMVSLIDAYRTILIEGKLPDFVPLLLLGLIAVGLLWLGYKVLIRTSYHFVEEL